MLAHPHCSLPAGSILRPCGPALCRLCCGPLLGPRHPPACPVPLPAVGGPEPVVGSHGEHPAQAPGGGRLASRVSGLWDGAQHGP